MATTKIGRGKVVVTGDDEMCYLISKQQTTLMKNLLKWMVGNAKPHFHHIGQLTEEEHEFNKPGGVILWKLFNNASKEAANLARNLVASGKASIMLAVKQWTLKASLDSYTFYPLLLESGVYLSRDVVNWSPVTWKMGIVPLIYTLSVSRQLDALSASTAVFVESDSQIVSKSWGALPIQMLKDIKAHDKLTHLADIYDHYLQRHYPCMSRQVSDPKQKSFMSAFSKLMINQGLAFTNLRAPGIKYFPGVLPRSAEIKDVKLEIVGDMDYEYHATGLYLPPGETLKISPLDATTKATLGDWNVRIGAHMDDISVREKWHRFPIISVRVSAAFKRVFSGFGGLVWLQNKKANSRIKVMLKGAVRTPHFNLRDPASMARWDSSGRKAPGPWAEIAGDMIVITVASTKVRNKTSAQLKALMREIWDPVVKQDHHLRGSDWRKSRRERFVVDVQTSVGYGHSGYPVMAFLSWTHGVLTKELNDKAINWGTCHEVGHNLQKKEWTFEVSDLT